MIPIKNVNIEKSRLPSHLMWLGIILCFATILHLYNLGGPSLWVDEMHRLAWAKGYEVNVIQGGYPETAEINRPVQPLTASMTTINRHMPPLNSIILNRWIRITGAESDFLLRLPFALFGIFSVLITYFALFRPFGAKAALAVALLVAVSPYHVFYSQELNHYSTAFFWVACTFFFFFRILIKPRFVDGIGLFVTGTAALYTHYFCIIILLFQGLSFLTYRPRLKRVIYQLLPYVAISAAFAPYLPTIHNQMRELTAFGGPFLGLSYFLHSILIFLSIPWLGYKCNYLPEWLLVLVGLLTCAAFITGIYKMEDKQIKRIILLNGIGPIFIVSVAYWIMQQNSILWPRYQLFFTFILFIPLAVALSDFKRYFTIPLAVVLIAMMGFGNYFQYRVLVKEDWKLVSKIIDQRAEKNDLIIVCNPVLTQSLARYLPRNDITIMGITAPESINQEVATIMAGPSTWYISIWNDKVTDEKIHSQLSSFYEGKENFITNPGLYNLTLTRYWAPRSKGTSKMVNQGTCVE